MGHNDEGDTDLMLQSLELELHLRAHLAVEGGEWLV